MRELATASRILANSGWKNIPYPRAFACSRTRVTARWTEKFKTRN